MRKEEFFLQKIKNNERYILIKISMRWRIIVCLNLFFNYSYKLIIFYIIFYVDVDIKQSFAFLKICPDWSHFYRDALKDNRIFQLFMATCSWVRVVNWKDATKRVLVLTSGLKNSATLTPLELANFSCDANWFNRAY